MSTEDHVAEFDGLLAASKWRAADELTGRLIVRSVAPDADTLYERNLDDLSVKLLAAVDATWRRHSHGRFGFEPQLRTLRRAHDDPELFATSCRLATQERGYQLLCRAVRPVRS